MKSIALLALSLLIISCSNVALETEPIKIESVESGRIMSVGEIFNISIDKKRGTSLVNPTHCSINVIPVDSESRMLKESEVLEFFIDLKENPNPQFKISDSFNNGLYSLNIEVYEEEELISEDSVEFIVYSDTIDVNVSALHPSKGLYTDSKVILKSDIILNSEIDPYLIWRFKDEIISKGYLSNGTDELLWDSEDNVGFNDIRVDIYPYKLTDIKTLSSFFTNFSLLVNPRSKNLHSSDAVEGFKKYLLFNGNYIDEINKDLNIVTVGEVEPVIVENFYGLRIGENSSFKTDDSLFSVTDDSFGNFSVLLDLLFEEESDNPIIVNKHGNLTFKLYYNKGSLTNVLYNEETVLGRVEIGSIDQLVPLRICISFIKTDYGFRSYYYLNGELKASEELYIDEALMEEYKSDSRSFELSGGSLIWDSFKVYSKANNIYSDNLLDFYRINEKKSPMFIEGFNSVTLPYGFIGDGSVDGEILNMSTGSKLVYNELLPTDSDFILEIKPKDNKEYILTLGDYLKQFDYPVTGSVNIAKKGEKLFINDVGVPDWESTYSNLIISAIDDLKLDSIVLSSRGN